MFFTIFLCISEAGSDFRVHSDSDDDSCDDHGGDSGEENDCDACQTMPYPHHWVGKQIFLNSG